MFEPAVVPVLNHLLRGASWAPAKLLVFAGRCVCFESGPLRVNFQIAPDGLLEAVAPEAAADLRITMAPPALARLLAGDAGARREAQVRGDTQFAQVVALIFTELRWDVEEDLSHIVGDIAARRLVQAGKTFATWQRDALARAAHNASEFWTEEDPLIASRHRLQAFVVDVDRLREDLERLAKRVQALRRP